MIKHIGAFTILWIAIAAGNTVYGQQKGHTLGFLWAEVKGHYPGIAARQSDVEAAMFNERAVKSNMFPQVKAQVQNTYGTYDRTMGAFFPQPGLFNVSGTAGLNGAALSPNTFASTIVEWELFSFGKLHKQNEATRAITGKKLSEKKAYLLQLKKTLSERYIDLLYNEAKLRWNEKNVERLNDIRKITAGLSSSGLKPAADSLLATSSYLQSQGKNNRLLGNRKASLIKLLELYPGDTVAYGASLIHFKEPDKTPKNEIRLISPSHPTLMALGNQSKYYQLRGKVQRKSALPSVSLMAGYAYRATGIGDNGVVSGTWKDGFSNPAENVLAGIVITWNVSDLYTKHLKANSLLRKAESTGYLQQQYKEAMQAELSASKAKIIQQFKEIKKTNAAVQQAEQAFEMYLARYESGLIDLSTLLQIQLLLEQAEDNHIDAAYKYWLLIANEAELTTDFSYLFNNL